MKRGDPSNSVTIDIQKFGGNSVRSSNNSNAAVSFQRLKTLRGSQSRNERPFTDIHLPNTLNFDSRNDS